MIFLSYAQKDGTSYVERLESALQVAGFETWRDTSNLHPASRIDVTIEDNIKRAEVVVVCITADVERDKSFVRNEIAYASILDKPIIIARFENVPPPISIVNRFWIEFHKQTWDAAFGELHKWLKQPLHEQKKLKDGVAVQAADPFRPYLESALKFIVEGLRQRIIVPIDLKAKDTPDAVNSPSQPKPRGNVFEQSFSGVKMGTVETKPEKRDFSTFREWFEYFEGRALLLGEPGAGKTITLMAYARDAYAARLDDPMQPLPLYNLVPTWNAEKRTPLHNWIAEAHSLDIEAVKREIDAGRALLLLDGLDELGREREIKNEKGEVEGKYDPRLRFLENLPSNNHILLTSRIQEYEEIGRKAAFNGAIRLQPLDDEQMRDYLRDQRELLELVEGDKQLRELTRTPLLMSIFAYAYGDLSESERQQLTELTDARDLRDKIFMQYIDQRYEHERAKVSVELPLTLDYLKDKLSVIAMDSIAHDWSQDNLRIRWFGNDTDKQLLVDVAIRLKLLSKRDDGTLSFIHILLRDTLAFTQILRILQENNNEKVTAILALKKNPDGRTVNLLIAYLNDRDYEFVQLLKDTLVETGKSAVEPLIDALGKSKYGERRRIIQILGRIGDTAAVEPLIAALNENNWEIQASAALALGRIGDSRATNHLINALNHYQPDVRTRAVEALSEMRSISAVAALINMLTDDEEGLEVDVPISWLAEEALNEIGVPAIAPLILTLRDANTTLSRRISKVLAKIGNSAVGALVFALNDEKKIVQNSAIDALIEIGTPEALEAVRKWRENEDKI